MTVQEFNKIKRLAVRPAGWNVMRDYLVLALDQAETGERDLQGTTDVADYLRSALQIAHARAEALTQ